MIIWITHWIWPLLLFVKSLNEAGRGYHSQKQSQFIQLKLNVWISWYHELSLLSSSLSWSVISLPNQPSLFLHPQPFPASLCPHWLGLVESVSLLSLFQHHKFKTKHMALDRVLSSVFHCFFWYFLVGFGFCPPETPRAHFLGMEQNKCCVYVCFSPNSSTQQNLAEWVGCTNAVVQGLIGSSWQAQAIW